jgi:hypothetical protein
VGDNNVLGKRLRSRITDVPILRHGSDAPAVGWVAKIAVEDDSILPMAHARGRYRRRSGGGNSCAIKLQIKSKSAEDKLDG